MTAGHLVLKDPCPVAVNLDTVFCIRSENINEQIRCFEIEIKEQFYAGHLSRVRQSEI